MQELLSRLDISRESEPELKDLIDQLKETLESHERLLQSVPIGIYRTTPEGKILFVNSYNLTLMRYSDLDAYLAVNAKNLYVNPEDRVRWQTLMDQQGEVLGFETQVKRGDGTIMWVRDNAKAIRGGDGSALYYEGTWEDITEQKELLEGLSSHASRMEALHEAAYSVVSSLDYLSTVDRCAEIAKELIGSDGVVIYRLDKSKESLRPVVAKGPHAEQIMAMTLRVGEGLSGEVALSGKPEMANRIHLTDKGKQVPGTPEEPESLICVPLKIKDNVIGVLTISRRGEEEFDTQDLEFLEDLANISAMAFQNATLYEQAQDEIGRRKKVQDRLRASDEMKGLLLDVITHDLKNPAGVITGIAALMLMERPDDEEAQLIKQSSDDLLKVLSNSATLSQVAGRETITKEKLDVDQMIGEVGRECNLDLKENAMSLEYDRKGNLEVYANPIIKEIFRNYLTNAIKYAASGKKISVEAKEERDFIVVSVKDFGKTIPKERRQDIFRRRFRMDDGIQKGQGLGLAIVKRIAEAHGAKVWVEPNQPQGNIFFLKLPRGFPEN